MLFIIAAHLDGRI